MPDCLHLISYAVVGVSVHASHVRVLNPDCRVVAAAELVIHMVEIEQHNSADMRQAVVGQLAQSPGNVVADEGNMRGGRDMGQHGVELQLLVESRHGFLKDLAAYT